MTEGEKPPARARYVGIVCTLVIAAIVVGGFAETVSVSSTFGTTRSLTAGVATTVTSTTAQAYPTEATLTTEYATSAPYVVTSVSQVTETSQVMVVGQATLYCNQSVYARSLLPAGSEVTVSWNATGKVDIYVLNSTQFDMYMASDTDEGIGEQIGPRTANQSGLASGELRFYAPLEDSYFLFVFNPSTSASCAGGPTLRVNSAGGTAVFAGPVTSFSTATVPYTATSELVSTRTLTTTLTAVWTLTEPTTLTFTGESEATCHPSFWAWLFGDRSC